MILINEDEEGAKAYVRQTISDLLMNRLDLSLLVITKVRTWNNGKYQISIAKKACRSSLHESRRVGRRRIISVKRIAHCMHDVILLQYLMK